MKTNEHCVNMTGKQVPDQKSMNKFTFSYDELREFLTFIKTKAEVGAMRNVNKAKGDFIILRQDIDLDFYPSYEVMKIQRELGMTSTFFVLTSSPTYNPQASRIRKMLREMAESGFEIGLHFDPSIYGDANHEKLCEKVEFECEILEGIIGEPVASISLHNPSISGEYPQFEGYLNAYSKALFSDDRYISDSMRVDPTLHPFRGKDPYAFVQNASSFPLQIVLHPEQFLESGGFYEDTINRYISDLKNELFTGYESTLEIIRRGRLYDLK